MLYTLVLFLINPLVSKIFSVLKDPRAMNGRLAIKCGTYLKQKKPINII